MCRGRRECHLKSRFRKTLLTTPEPALFHTVFASISFPNVTGLKSCAVNDGSWHTTVSSCHARQAKHKIQILKNPNPPNFFTLQIIFKLSEQSATSIFHPPGNEEKMKSIVTKQ